MALAFLGAPHHLRCGYCWSFSIFERDLRPCPACTSEAREGEYGWREVLFRRRRRASLDNEACSINPATITYTVYPTHRLNNGQLSGSDICNKLQSLHPISVSLTFHQPSPYLPSALYRIPAQSSSRSVYGDGYGFSILQVGLIYLGPGLGFLTAVWFIVPKIDTIYNRLSEKHGESKPEFRLPIANIGSILIPISLFVWIMGFPSVLLHFLKYSFPHLMHS